jgi:hypothetical protein
MSRERFPDLEAVQVRFLRELAERDESWRVCTR